MERLQQIETKLEANCSQNLEAKNVPKVRYYHVENEKLYTILLAIIVFLCEINRKEKGNQETKNFKEILQELQVIICGNDKLATASPKATMKR